MNLLRGLAFVLAFAAATTLIFGALGFSSVAADRGVAVSVVEDDSAYVGMTACDRPATKSSGHPIKVSIQNLFGIELVIDEIDGTLEEGPEPPDSIDPGTEETFTVRVANGTEEVILHAHTTRATVEVTRDIQEQSASACGSSTRNSSNSSNGS